MLPKGYPVPAHASAVDQNVISGKQSGLYVWRGASMSVCPVLRGGNEALGRL